MVLDIILVIASKSRSSSEEARRGVDSTDSGVATLDFEARKEDLIEKGAGLLRDDIRWNQLSGLY